MKKKKILITIILMFLVMPISKTSAMMEGKPISSSINQEQEPNKKIFEEIEKKVDYSYIKYRDKFNSYGIEVKHIGRGILNKTNIEQGNVEEAKKKIKEIQKDIEKTRTEINEEKENIEKEIENQIKNGKDKTELKQHLKYWYDLLKEYIFYTSNGEKVSIFELCGIEINNIDINWKIVKLYNKYYTKFNGYGKEVKDIVKGILNKTNIKQKDYDEAIQRIEIIQKEIEKTRTEINEEKKKIAEEIENQIKNGKDKTELKKDLKYWCGRLEAHTVYTSSADEVSIFELCGIEIKKLEKKLKETKKENVNKEAKDKLEKKSKETKKENVKEIEEYIKAKIGILGEILNKRKNETNVNEIIIDMGMLENIKNKLEGKDLGDYVYFKSVISTMKLTLNCRYRNMLIREIKGKIEQAKDNKNKKELLEEVLKKQCVDINTIKNLITKLENSNKDEDIDLIKQFNNNALTELTELRNTMGKLEKNQ